MKKRKEYLEKDFDFQAKNFTDCLKLSKEQKERIADLVIEFMHFMAKCNPTLNKLLYEIFRLTSNEDDEILYVFLIIYGQVIKEMEMVELGKKIKKKLDAKLSSPLN